MSNPLEPEATKIVEAYTELGLEPRSLEFLSIAISLKRIADNICYQQAGENIFDYIRQIAQAAEERNNRR